ncbi:MAG: hypothetical protein ACKOK8_17520, partial [Planctomycetia bacterium]
MRHLPRLRSIVVIAACLLQAGFAIAAPPADWARWRGHEGAGQGGDVSLPGDWNAITWKWKATLPGEGHGSPVVFRGGVY